jgi:hypothetical protein
MKSKLLILPVTIILFSCSNKEKSANELLIQKINELEIRIDSLSIFNNRFLNIENKNGRIYGNVSFDDKYNDVIIVYNRIFESDEKHEFTLYFSTYISGLYRTYHSKINQDDTQIIFNEVAEGHKNAGSIMYSSDNSEITSVYIKENFQITKLDNEFYQIRIPISFFDWRIPERVWIWDSYGDK